MMCRLETTFLMISFGAMSVQAPIADAAEGGSSNYFPGAYGDFAAAVAPDPGWIYANYGIFYSAEIAETVLQGSINLELDTFAYVNLSMLSYAFEEPVLGAHFMMGVFVPLGYVELDATVTDGMTNLSVSDDETNLGDISIVPASFYWDADKWHFNLYEMVVTPTGQYDASKPVSMGRNYWSFDTVFASTYLNPESGREFSFSAGLMTNTTNEDTDYRTGDEFHIDVMLNQYLSESFGIGLHGYYYRQTSGDRGDGAVLGKLEGESVGIGPSFIWIPKSGGGRFSVSGTWLHDIDTNASRIDSDYVVVTLAWLLGRE